MATVSNTMIITDSSLASISKELINKRVYKENLITIIGTPNIINGIANNINSNNYFATNNFNFTENSHSVKITFEGSYSPTDLLITSCAYELSGGSNSLSLLFTPNSVKLNLNSSIIKEFSDITFKSTNEINISIDFLNSYSGVNDLTSQQCAITLVVNNTVYADTVNLNELIHFNTFNSLLLGNNLQNDYWRGTINLASFAIYENNKILYTPSTKNSFIFTKIMISDSVFPLTDNSAPILDHIYEYPITEISRTENNILLTSVIPEEAYLGISQIGLYCTDATGTHLFSIVNGLSIKKTTDLAYNLIIHVKLDINVVNTVALPEIVIKEEGYINFSEFNTVKQVYAYITENLERMIKTNALGIGSYVNGYMSEYKPVGVGYDTAQVYYRLQSSLALWEDNFVATNNYAKTKHKFTPYEVINFDPSNINLIGDAYLSDDGILSVLSDYNYAYANSLSISSENSWKFSTDFSVMGDVTTKQSIVTFSSEAVGQPLTLSIQNGKCVLTIDAIDEAIISDGTNTHLFKRNGVINLDNTKYYRWTTEEDIVNKNLLTTKYKDILTSDPIYSEAEVELSGWQLTQQINSSIINNVQLFDVNMLKEYKVIISYLNDIYTVSYEVDKTTYTNVFSIASTKALNNVDQVLFGVDYDGSVTMNPFSGQINLYNTSIETYVYNDGLIKTYISNFRKSSLYDKKLLDYFHLPIYAHSYFLINNLGFEEESYLEEYEGAFKGYNDHLDFNNSKGFTLCTKVHLHNNDNKVLLAKGNISSNEYYFVLEQLNNSLKFSLYLPEDTLVLKKDLNPEEIRGFIERPITVTIMCNGNPYSPEFKMYKNNELLDSRILPSNSAASIAEMYLMNHEAFTSEEDLKIHTVYDILDFEGMLNAEELYYINNILDTNF